MAPEVWYNHFCGAHPLPLRRSLQTGELVRIGKNDLGGEYETDDKFEFCRRINDGFCSKFEANKRSDT